jgi:hypothetical protein
MSAKIAEFLVNTSDGTDKVALCTFATLPDLKEIALWPRQVRRATDAVTLDALEFAKLSSKRWRFYHGQGRTVASVATMKRKISASSLSDLVGSG